MSGKFFTGRRTELTLLEMPQFSEIPTRILIIAQLINHCYYVECNFVTIL
jgi:hypothetical protein